MHNVVWQLCVVNGHVPMQSTLWQLILKGAARAAQKSCYGVSEVATGVSELATGGLSPVEPEMVD